MENLAINLSEQLSDLKSCEQEPVHFIGSIQTHGCLICFTLPDRRVQAASENIADFLGRSHKEILSAKLEHVLDPKFSDEVVGLTASLPENSGRFLSYDYNDEQYTAYVYSTSGMYCLELERLPKDGESISRQEADKVVRDCLVSLRNGDTLTEIGTVVCRAIRDLTGFDRVMMYRFIAPAMHGEVIAEDRVVNAHSYNRHRFPASDIPRIARDLYLRNGVRAIPDVNAPISKVSPDISPKTKAPIDLSDSRLRAVSPIHLEYLRNMKLGASYSFAVVVKGELWGLIACHHLTPHYVDAEKRTAAELIANAFAAQAPLIEQIGLKQQRIVFGTKMKNIIDSLRFSSDPISDLFKGHQALFDALNITGLALVTDSSVDFAGLVPTGSHLKDLAQALRSKMTQENKVVLAIQNLTEVMTDWKSMAHTASGVLALKIDGIENGILMFFRPEQIETIVWGGDPRKQLDKKGFTGRINPRSSFEAWEETIRFQSKPWAKFEVEIMSFFKDLIFETLSPKQKLLQELSADRSKRT